MTQTPPKRGRGRPPKGEASEARQALLDAALIAFARTGFQATSIGEIAKMANVAKPLVHYHFASKDELWKQAVTYGFDHFRDEAIKLGMAARQADPDDLLLAFTRAVVRASAKHPYIHQISLDELRQGGPRADWLIETYILPISKAAVTGFVGMGLLPAKGDDLSHVAHLIPAMHGAMNFPFMDPNTQRIAFGADVFSEEYVEEHAIFAAKLLRFALQQLSPEPDAE